MEKIEGYNRNLRSGKRPHRKIQRFGKYKTLAERYIAECIAYKLYLERVNIPIDKETN